MAVIDKMRSDDRILVLSIQEGKSAKGSTGLLDTRLFSGDNQLHAVKDPTTCFWYLKYDKGGVPEALKGRYTAFKDLLKFAQAYFNERNIDIKEVKD